MKKIFLFFYRIIKKFLPHKINYFIWDIYLSNISKKSYSQYGEDLIICSYFQRHFKDKQGNYLDIGCYHPKGISNTHLLHRAGWEGIVVDIDDYKYIKEQALRGNSVGKAINKVLKDFYDYIDDEGTTHEIYKGVF